ncbi:MAG: ABC transporter permease [Candidatus Omnitrophota bacterium]
MKIWTIIKNEYRQIVKKRSFLISTILTPAMMAALMFLPVLMNKVGREEKVIEIVDYSGFIQKRFLEKSRTAPEAREVLKLTFISTDAIRPEQNRLIKAYEQHLSQRKDANLPLLSVYKKRILEKKRDGVLLIPDSILTGRRVYYCALNISDFETNKYITSLVQRIVSEKILIDQHIRIDIVNDAIRDIDLGAFKVKKEGISRTTSGAEYLMSIFMLSILFSIIMGYGQLTMRGVIEEKNSRIIEILISSARATHLFYGKIIGIGLAGLTQVVLWIGLAAIFMGQPTVGIETSIINFLTPELAFYFIVFFIIGYFMSAILFAIIGASVNTDQEAQQFAAPLIYLLFIPFIIGVVVTQSPDTLFVIVVSMFPLFTPTLMFMRITVAIPALWQVWTSIAISAIFTIFLAWLGAKIFRVGILMYGKKPTIKEMMKWLRYK